MPSFSTTDIVLLNQLADRLLEPNSLPAAPTIISTQWNISDFVAALNDGQREFLKLTGLVTQHLGYRGDTNTSIGITANVEKFPLPQDCVDPLRLAFVAYDTQAVPQVASVTELPREDSWTLDAFESDWEQTSGTPDAFTESLATVPAVYLAHPPADIGQIDLLYVQVSAALSNTGVKVSVPDEFTPAIIYRALGILLRKEGEAHDEERAQYCDQMFDLWVGITMSLLSMPYSVPVEG